jgi:hypothetical protein
MSGPEIAFGNQSGPRKLQEPWIRQTIENGGASGTRFTHSEVSLSY